MCTPVHHCFSMRTRICNCNWQPNGQLLYSCSEKCTPIATIRLGSETLLPQWKLDFRNKMTHVFYYYFIRIRYLLEIQYLLEFDRIEMFRIEMFYWNENCKYLHWNYLNFIDRAYSTDAETFVFNFDSNKMKWRFELSSEAKVLIENYMRKLLLLYILLEHLYTRLYNGILRK